MMDLGLIRVLSRFHRTAGWITSSKLAADKQASSNGKSLDRRSHLAARAGNAPSTTSDRASRSVDRTIRLLDALPVEHDKRDGAVYHVRAERERRKIHAGDLSGYFCRLRG